MRKFFFKIHLWLSLPFGIIIAIVCLTGAILVFEKEILEWSNPSHYFVEEVKAEPLSPAEMLTMARQQLPDSIKFNGLRVTPDPKRTYQIVLPARKSVAFIDPYTGEVKGIDDGRGFFLKTMQIHRWLFSEYKRGGSPSLGKQLVGYSTLVLVIIILSGLVIWWPRSRKSLKNRLKIKVKKGWFRFFYDLHVAGGFYAALLLLVLCLTGLTWSFGWYRNAFYAAFGVSTEQPQTHAPAPTAQSEVAVSEDGERGRGGQRGEGERQGRNEDNDSIPRGRRGNRTEGSEGSQRGEGGLRGERGNRNQGGDSGESGQRTERNQREKKPVDYIHWAEVIATLQNKYEDYNYITVQDGSATVSTAKYGNTRGSDSYKFDPATGKITETNLYKDLPKSAKIRGWIYSVHVGSWGGITTRILSCLVTLLGGIFAITGYYFWIRKKVKRQKLNPKRQLHK